KPEVLSSYLFEPVLFYLALLANSEAYAGAPSPRDWLAARDLHVHICGNADIQLHSYRFSGHEAADYLSELAADFLQPGAFDLLPFEIVSGKDLAGAFTLPDELAGPLAADYRERLEESIEEAADNFYGNFWRSPL